MNICTKIFCAALLLLSSTGAFTSAQAQINININSPSWGPAAPAGTQYYYIPDIGGYYDLRGQRYIVYRNNAWTRVTSLNGYNPANFHPVIIDYRGSQPWVLIRDHRAKYPKAMPPGQAKKYYGVHPGKGNGHGNGKSHGKGKH
ncbi:hypothetical protein [Hymenobacter guriensis]|uniref:Uncharacterized protein n=1 Tax=Hymenobacter guriensis TaxID=2793065 RepID=A0ABS0L2Q0_9BACT|nr:hypothetical protein [Hymenobacter guriensis]MBG8554396.1 hypothetical protein [Hymenobacter guriensis]